MRKNTLQEFPLGEPDEWFVGSDGEMYEAIDGTALTGERSEDHYKKRGPYLKVSANGVAWAKARMQTETEMELRAEVAELTERLSRIAGFATSSNALQGDE